MESNLHIDQASELLNILEKELNSNQYIICSNLLKKIVEIRNKSTELIKLKYRQMSISHLIIPDTTGVRINYTPQITYEDNHLYIRVDSDEINFLNTVSANTSFASMSVFYPYALTNSKHPLGNILYNDAHLENEPTDIQLVFGVRREASIGIPQVKKRFYTSYEKVSLQAPDFLRYLSPPNMF